MTISDNARQIISQINHKNTKLGDLKKIAKETKIDHELAMELWESKEFYPRLLSVLIMDKNKLTQDFIETIANDAQSHEYLQCNQIADWLLANQLMKNKRTIELLKTWENHPSPILRRLFWYYQARLRWTGKNPLENSEQLFSSLKKNMEKEKPKVRWAMNFCAGQIGVYDLEFQSQCIELGEKLGLYKDEPIVRGCTPNYLPEFIRIEFAKLKK